MFKNVIKMRQHKTGTIKIKIYLLLNLPEFSACPITDHLPTTHTVIWTIRSPFLAQKIPSDKEKRHNTRRRIDLSIMKNPITTITASSEAPWAPSVHALIRSSSKAQLFNQIAKNKSISDIPPEISLIYSKSLNLTKNHNNSNQ